jgi:membrane protease YdiL (CAAX protease family)
MGPDLPLALDRSIDAVPVGDGRDPFAFIDLARLGRSDGRSALKAFLRILGWQVLVGVAVGIALYFWGQGLPEGVGEVVVLATATAGWLLGLRSAALKAHGRPLLSFVSPALRIDFRRIGLGALFWIVANVIVTAAAAAFYALAHPAAAAAVMDDFAPPPRGAFLIAGLISIALFPLQAACEELAFRGWLTQTLGQVLRRRWLLVLVVGLLFALAHAPYAGPFAFPVYIIMSVGLSALTLLDQRVELAIGAHAANNIFVVIVSLFLADPLRHHTLFLDGGPVPWWAVPEAAVQFGLVYAMAYGLMRRFQR